MIDSTNDSELIIKAIANEIRRNIVRLLIGDALSYTEIAHLLGYNLKSESGKFNFHLKELVNAGLIVNADDAYQLTERGEEIYYLLVDIERDREIDPHGMISALIRLEGMTEFNFFVASLLLIISLQGMILGAFAFFGLDTYLPLQILGLTLGLGGVICFFYAGRYYVMTLNRILDTRSIGSKLVSSFFLLNIQWYFIRGKYRLQYLAVTFFLLLGWMMGLLGIILHLASLGGIEDSQPVFYILEGVAVVTLLIGSIILRGLYMHSREDEVTKNQQDIV